MSKALNIAGLIKTRLTTAPAEGELATPLDITGVDVIVFRQKSLQAKIDAAVGKDKGTAIVIIWQGFRTLDKNSGRPRLAQSYNITVWSQPVISGSALPADDVMESIILRLWQWIPVGKSAYGEAEVRDGGIMPDKKFLKYDCEVLIPATL